MRRYDLIYNMMCYAASKWIPEHAHNHALSTALQQCMYQADKDKNYSNRLLQLIAVKARLRSLGRIADFLHHIWR